MSCPSGEYRRLPQRTAFVVPVYNHGRQVKAVLDKVMAMNRPVFVVNDGSTDSTARVLSSMKGIHVLTHDCNQGKGAALITGFSAAAEVADWAVTVDADGQHEPEDAIYLMNAVSPGQRALVLGVREGMDRDRAPWTSRWGRWFSNVWVRMASGRWFRDSQSGFRVYPLPETLSLPTRGRRYQFEVEVIALAVWSGLPVLQAPIRVNYYPEGGRISHFRPFMDFWRNTRVFARLIVQRIFIPAGIRARKK